MASDALEGLLQSNQVVLQQMWDGITEKLSREYKTLKQNVPRNWKLLSGDDSPNFSHNKENSKKFKGFSRTIISTKTFFEEEQ